MRKHLIFFGAVIVLIAILTACASKKDETMEPITPAPTAVAKAAPAGTDAPVTGDVQEVKLIASSATFKYDQESYKVKKGAPVKLTLEMKDGNHGARLADFDINLTSENPTATFTPTEAGTYTIKCSVPCGDGHREMSAQLIVE